jgi:hypothetical protein
MMKAIIMVSCVVATNAMALDFDTEWAKYASDFDKLKQKTVVVASRSVVTPVPRNTVEVIDKSIKLPEKNTEVNVLQQVDPKSPERLGYKLEDPTMRDRVIDAYNKPNAVVYSATLK